MSMLAAAIVGGSISAVGAIGSTAIGATTATQGRRAQEAANRESLEFQKVVRAQNIFAIKHAMDRGLISVDEAFAQAEGLLQPLANLQPLEDAQQLLAQGPGELTPQQEREFGRGVEALQAGFSRTSGGGVSSRALENAQVFGQDFEARRLDEQLNRLIPFINLATGARTNLANLATGRGTTRANILQAASGQVSGVPTQGIADTISRAGDIKAAGGINVANQAIGGLSNLSNIAGNFTNLALQRPELFSGGGGGPELFSGNTGIPTIGNTGTIDIKQFLGGR